MDAELSFREHATHLTRNSYYIRQLWQVRDSLTRPACETLVHAFITSRLDYCNAVLAGASKTVLNVLQLIQNAAARVITRGRRWQHITPILLDLHWLRVQERVTFKLALLVYKSLHGLAPSYLVAHCIPLSQCAGRQGLRSHSAGDLHVPRALSATYGSKPFAISGPKVWNQLPLTVKNSSSLVFFKSSLKTHLLNYF